MNFSRMGAAYETAPTKQYYRGRTETHRSCTPEVRAWCEAMVNPKVEVSQTCVHLIYFVVDIFIRQLFT